MTYFNSQIQRLGELPIYVIESLLKIANAAKSEFKKNPSLYAGNCVTPASISDVSLKTEIYTIINRAACYILSLGEPALREMVPIERALAVIPSGEIDLEYFKRYVDRVGEKIVIPLLGNFNVNGQLLPVGSIHRVNNRTNLKISSQNGAVLLVINFLDIDLDEHLTIIDKAAVFPLTSEEGGDVKSSERAFY